MRQIINKIFRKLGYVPFDKKRILGELVYKIGKVSDRLEPKQMYTQNIQIGDLYKVTMSIIRIK